ncbi:MAG: hypothetical protein JNM24_14765 [Bdellovibrionaceae bacterium]|nr:hypothetical protein [Pseudobdellovibrionaceae bacterium]
MTINKIKPIIVLTILLVLGGAVSMKSNYQDKTLRVAFPVRLKTSAYEPTNINFDYEYIFLENIFSPLVEISASGSVEPGVAEKVEWAGDELKLIIRENLKTISGNRITADDVVFSLKRLLVLSGNTHGNFKDVVCPGVDIKSTEEECPGIRQNGNTVYLNAKGRKSFLLPMLGAIDFAVIPKSSVDPTTLKIINYSETSGPYSVDSDDGNGNIVLKQNPHHYFSTNEVAKKIVIVPTDLKSGNSSIAAFKEGRVDHITTIDATKPEDIINFAQSNLESELHVTMKIRTLVLVFTQKGEKEFSEAERRYIGKQMKVAFNKIYHGVAGVEQRSDFFPNLSEGGLSVEQQNQLKVELNKSAINPKREIRLGIIRRGSLEEWANPIKELLPQVNASLIGYIPDFKKDLAPEEIPHAFIGFTDTGFMEDIGLISYSLNSGVLGLDKEERAKWLAGYMAVDDKEKRIKKLKQLHFEALARPSVVPLMALSYTALIRKPWKIELSELYANNQLWRIKLH